MVKVGERRGIGKNQDNLNFSQLLDSPRPVSIDLGQSRNVGQAILILEDFWTPDLNNLDGSGAFKIPISIFLEIGEHHPDLSRPWLLSTSMMYTFGILFNL